MNNIGVTTHEERIRWLEANIGASWWLIGALGICAVIAVVAAICTAYNGHDINNLRADLDEADGEHPEGVPGRLRALERDVEGLRQQVRAHDNIAAVEFDGNFVGPDDFDTGPVQPIVDEPRTAPLEAQRPTPMPRPRIVPPVIAGPTTDTKSEAIDRGHKQLIEDDNGIETEWRQVGAHRFKVRATKETQ